MKTRAPKPKTCRNSLCREKFVPARPMQVVCGPRCAYVLATTKQRKEREKRERKELREAKERIKSRSDHMADTQQAFNAYIRERDHALPCVSCGRLHKGQWHAGHYRTVGGNPELRFEPLNVWRQCQPCNNHKSGDIVNYRIELVRRIGEEKVRWLEGPHEPKKYTIEELNELKRHYRQLTRELKRKRGAL